MAVGISEVQIESSAQQSQFSSQRSVASEIRENLSEERGSVIVEVITRFIFLIRPVPILREFDLNDPSFL